MFDKADWLGHSRMIAPIAAIVEDLTIPDPFSLSARARPGGGMPLSGWACRRGSRIAANYSSCVRTPSLTSRCTLGQFAALEKERKMQRFPDQHKRLRFFPSCWGRLCAAKGIVAGHSVPR